MSRRGVSPPFLSPLLPFLSKTDRAADKLLFSPSQAPHFPGLSHTHQQLVSPRVLVPPLLICLPVSLCQEHPYLKTAHLSSRISSALNLCMIPFSPSHPVKCALPPPWRW